MEATSANPKANPQRWLAGAVIVLCLARLLVMALQPFTGLTEARYAEIARKMLETGNWVTPQIDYGVPFWAKPPLSTWTSAISMGLFGVNEFAARLPSFLFALLTIWLVVSLGNARYGKGSGLLVTAILASFAMFFFGSGSVMTDSALTFSVTLVMVAFWRTYTGERLWGHVFFAALGIGLLAKGPLAGVLTVIPLFLWLMWRRDLAFLRRLPWVAGITWMLLIAAPWYTLAEIRTPGFLEYFIVGEHIKRFLVKDWTGDLYGHVHAQPIGMIWVFWLMGILPWSLLLPGLLWRRRAVREALTDADGWVAYLLLWAGFPLVFFTMARNIIPPYVLPGLPPVALLAALLVQGGPANAGRLPRWVPALVLVVPVLAVAATLVAHRLPAWLDDYTQKPVVEQYLNRRPGPDSQLVYFMDRDNSAEFYSQGKARNVDTIEALLALLDNRTQDYLVLRKSMVRLLPERLKPVFKPVGEFGERVLLEEQVPAQTGDGPHGE